MLDSVGEWTPCLLCMEEGSFPVSLQLLSGGTFNLLCLYDVLLFMSFGGGGIGTMLANYYMCGIMLVLRAVFNMLVRNGIPGGSLCVKCLIFSSSGPRTL